MLIKKHKTGQATIVLIVVTMMTVLGVAVASSSQTRINLRDTVYSTQSVQALACAEAGGDRALVSDEVEDESIDFTHNESLSSADSSDYSVGGCDGYDVAITSYPAQSGDNVTIANVPENSTQQFKTDSFDNSFHNINFRSNNEGSEASLAIYKYYGADSVERTMVHCDSNNDGTPTDYETALGNQTFTLDDGETEVEGCSYNMEFDEPNQVALRIRSLQAPVLLQVENFTNPTGFKLLSTGTAGQVQRDINILKFFSQLPGSFDEAIVAGGSVNDEP